jgi:hypothetical protein
MEFNVYSQSSFYSNENINGKNKIKEGQLNYSNINGQEKTKGYLKTNKIKIIIDDVKKDEYDNIGYYLTIYNTDQNGNKKQKKIIVNKKQLYQLLNNNKYEIKYLQ